MRLTHCFAQLYDADRLQRELTCVLEHHEVVPHYRSYLANGWGAVTLVGPNGDAHDHRAAHIIKGESVEYRRTPAMEHAPYIEEIVSGIPGRPNRVRLMRLQAGRKIFWHHDGGLFGLDRKIARFHIPIRTNARVHLQVSHEDCRWQEGRLYFLDNSFPHRLVNGGAEDRIHLVFDIEVTPELLGLFPAEFRERHEQLAVLRQRCARWLDATYGNVYRLQKRWQKKREKLQRLLQPSRETGNAKPHSVV